MTGAVPILKLKRGDDSLIACAAKGMAASASAAKIGFVFIDVFLQKK
jgi:hypothetical protein